MRICWKDSGSVKGRTDWKTPDINVLHIYWYYTIQDKLYHIMHNSCIQSCCNKHVRNTMSDCTI